MPQWNSTSHQQGGFTADSLTKMAQEMALGGFGEAKTTSPKAIVKDKPKPEGVKLLKVGADIEEFLRDQSGKPVPVVGLIGGSKDNPLPVLRDGFALQEDNVALEYNIPPASDSHTFVYNLMRIREEIDERVKKLGLVPATEASMRFDMKDLQSEQARIFGCDPDYNVWEQAENEKPEAKEENANLRTAGGHVHISFLVNGKAPKLPDDLGTIEAFVMGMDCFVGVPFSLIDPDKERRQLYGKAGAFRPKPEYGGFEYRVLSNHWTRSPKLMAYVYKQVEKVVEYLNCWSEPRAKLLDYKDYVYQAINEGNEKAAHRILHHFAVRMP